MNYTQSTLRDPSHPVSKLYRHWRPNPPFIEQYIQENLSIILQLTVQDLFIHIKYFCGVQLAFFSPFIFYYYQVHTDKYIHVQLNFDGLTIDIWNISLMC